MISNIIKYFASAAVIMSLTSCEKELDFEYHNIDSLPVIEASITQDGASVAISYATPMGESFSGQFVENAEVTIVDLTDGAEFDLEPSEDGSFRCEMTAHPGHDYRLSVALDGSFYSSVSRMMKPTEITDARFQWVKMPGDDMAVFTVRFTDTPLVEDFYWVRLYRNGKSYSWSVISDHAAENGSLEESITTTHRNESLEDEDQIILDGDEITVSVAPISHSMADYLIALSNSSNGAPQFEGPRCLGYFLASPVATTSVIYHPDEIEYANY